MKKKTVQGNIKKKLGFHSYEKPHHQNGNLIYIFKILLVVLQAIHWQNVNLGEGNSTYVIVSYLSSRLTSFYCLVQWNSTARIEWLGFISTHYFKTRTERENLKLTYRKSGCGNCPVGTSPNKKSARQTTVTKENFENRHCQVSYVQSLYLYFLIVWIATPRPLPSIAPGKGQYGITAKWVTLKVFSNGNPKRNFYPIKGINGSFWYRILLLPYHLPYSKFVKRSSNTLKLTFINENTFS